MQYMKKTHPNFIIPLLGEEEKLSACYKIRGLRFGLGFFFLNDSIIFLKKPELLVSNFFIKTWEERAIDKRGCKPLCMGESKLHRWYEITALSMVIIILKRTTWAWSSCRLTIQLTDYKTRNIPQKRHKKHTPPPLFWERTATTASNDFWSLSVRCTVQQKRSTCLLNSPTPFSQLLR